MENNEDNVLCRQKDVKQALNNTIARFCEEGHSTINDLMKLLEEEMSKVPLFAPLISAASPEALREQLQESDLTK